ncbi:hypothetical protein Tco_0880307, partial [Tanacetum coccineum]
DKDADLSVKIEQGFGPDGLGILSISDVPGYASLRQNLLNLAPRLASLLEEVLKELEDPRSRYNFGWSHGKEKLESGKPGEICSWIISAESNDPQDDDSMSSWCGWHTDHGSLTGITYAIYTKSGIKIPCPNTAAGHPNVDALINTYLANEKDVDVDVDALQTNEFKEYYAEDVAELEQYLSSLQELKRKVLTRADELLMMNNAPALFGSNLNNNTPIQGPNVLQGLQGQGPNVMQGLQGPNVLQHLQGQGLNVMQGLQGPNVLSPQGPNMFDNAWKYYNDLYFLEPALTMNAWKYYSGSNYNLGGELGKF